MTDASAPPAAHDSPASELLDKIVGCPKLPTLPAVAIEILELTGNASTPLKKIAECVELDQALSVKILKTINSSFYGLSTPCPTIARAINYLGLNTVRSLVLGFSLVDTFRSPEGSESFGLVAHWRRAIYGAVAARLSAAHLPGCDPDEAFIGAMLRDIGSLATAVVLGSEYDDVLQEAHGIHVDLSPAEKQALGITHSEIGAVLAQHWRMPPELVETIRLHHDLNMDADAPAQYRCVALASLVTDALSEITAERGRAMGPLRDHAQKWFGLDRAAVAALLDEVKTGSAELSRLFAVDTGSKPDIDAILLEAEETKIQVQLDQERESQQLRASNDELARQRFTDGLTGAQNRAAFDRDLANAFDEAQAPGGQMAVAFIDADKFKSVNDTLGHQAGDEVLIELSSRLRRTAGNRGGVYRYGGEEFAVLLNNADAAEASHLAELLRKTIDATPFDLSRVGIEEPLGVTISIGVAVYDHTAQAHFEDASAILKAADDAVYAAKENGRNRVCLYEHEPEQEAQTDAPSSASTGAPADEGSLSVLLIDDDTLHQKLLKTAFEKAGNTSVLTASSVSEAVKMLHFGINGQPYAPQLVITDLNMPKHSGLKFVRFMRASKTLSMVPVIVLSGSDQTDDVRRCLEAGASAYIPKSRLSEDPFEVTMKVIDFWSIASRAA